MTHQTTIEVVRSIPDEVDAGLAETIVVRVTCRDGCSMADAPILVTDQAGAEVPALREPDPECDGISLQVTLPATVGEVVWRVSCPSHERDGVEHPDGAPVEIRFRTLAHKTSVAVWDVRSPIPVGEALTAKIGMRCSAACTLGDQLVRVLDEEGRSVGEGRLGATPLAGTDALYWAVIPFAAPTTEGLATRSAVLVDTLALPHEPAHAAFTFMATPAPVFRVTLTVTDVGTKAGIEGVEVRIGLYRASTDARGEAVVVVPPGGYEVSIRRDGYAAEPVQLEATSDVSLTIAATPVPTMAERARTLTSFDGYPWG